MKDDILTVMQNEMSSFSKGQKRIAAYILEDYNKAAFMTASRLGKTVGVSESTVVRFAIELGYEGYPSMQRAMQEMVLNRLTSVQRLEIAHEQMADQDVLTSVLHSDAEKIRQTVESVDRDAFNAAVEALLNGKQIYILGARSAAALANFAGYYMKYMFKHIHVVTTTGGGEMLERLINVEEGDVVLAFSFPRYSTATVKGVRYCDSVGATVISVTNSQTSPLAAFSDYGLVAKSNMVYFADSLVAPLSMVDALLVALASRKGTVLEKNFDTLEHLWEEYHIYEK